MMQLSYLATTSTLLNFSRYMNNDVAVLPNGYSKAVINIVNLLDQQLFSDIQLCKHDE